MNPLVPLFLNRTFSFYDDDFNPFEEEEEKSANLFHITNQNNFLANYQNIRRDEMDEEEMFFKRICNLRN